MKASLVWFNVEYYDDIVHKIIDIECIEKEYKDIVSNIYAGKNFSELTDTDEDWLKEMPDTFEDTVHWLGEEMAILDIIPIPDDNIKQESSGNNSPNVVTSSSWSVTYK